MPPLPKDARTRRRRNRTATAAKLIALPTGKAPAPPLPDIRSWRPETVEWWQDVWASPMAPEFLPSDTHGLVVLALLVDDFFHEPSPKLAAEIRLQRQCFGLTPIDRRRLQWQVDRGEEAEERRASRAATPRRRRTDPRKALSS